MFPSYTFFPQEGLITVEILFELHYSVHFIPNRAMATKLVCLLISSYLLLAGDYHVVSGFTPVTYSSESSSTECGQSDPLQDDQLMEALSKIHQELGPPGCNPPLGYRQVQVKRQSTITLISMQACFTRNKVIWRTSLLDGSKKTINNYLSF